jgi:hypothetical protein
MMVRFFFVNPFSFYRMQNSVGLKGLVGPYSKFYEGPDEEQTYSSFFNLGSRWGWVVNATPRPLYSGKRDTVAIV